MFAHSTSRVVQSCLKQGNKRQRTVIYEELKDEFVNMCKNRYAKNVAWKLVKYGLVFIYCVSMTRSHGTTNHVFMRNPVSQKGSRFHCQSLVLE